MQATMHGGSSRAAVRGRRWASCALAALTVVAAACGHADARPGETAGTTGPSAAVTTSSPVATTPTTVPPTTLAPVTRPTSGTLPLPATTVLPASTLPADDPTPVTDPAAPVDTAPAGAPGGVPGGPSPTGTPATTAAGGAPGTGTTRTTKPPAAPAPASPAVTTATPVSGKAFGTIEIPRLGLSVPLFEGITTAVLDRGPGHWPGTALPGQKGNAVVAGHRVSHTKPFRYIDQLQVGDPIIYNVGGKRYTYYVTETFIVTPQQVDIVRQGDAYETTLFACHPPGSIQYRYVVRARLAGT